MSGRTLRAAHFSIRTGGMWLYMSRLSTDSGSKPRESMNCLQEQTRRVSSREAFRAFRYSLVENKRLSTILTHSSVSFLPSILATTSRSSLAFSSLEEQKNRTDVEWRRCSLTCCKPGLYLYSEEAS